MRKPLVLLSVCLLVSVTAVFGQNVPDLNPGAAENHHIHKFPVRGWANPGGGGQNLNYHRGGAVIQVAHVVMIFWGPSFSNAASPDSSYASTLQAFRNQFGTNSHYGIITQYYQNLGSGNQFIQLSNLALGTPDWFDTSTPPTNVTDADVQAEVNRYLATHTFDGSAIYEV